MTNRMRKIVITATVILLGIAIVAIVLGITLDGAFAVAESNKNASAAYGSGAVVIEQTSGRVLYRQNPYARLYPASTTKILTALCVLNALSLDHKITVPKKAVGIEGSSIYLREGETLTVEELLLGLMLRSGNDAAVALALAVSPSIEEFASLMNRTASECGATDSNFVNPHGLHDDNHYTTALDLALITARAYENAEFRRIAATRYAKISGVEEDRHIANKNKMLYLFDGANGVKTGFTKKSGRCLVSSAVRDGMQLICVVLNHPNMWNDSISMLENAFANFKMTPVELALFNGESDIDKIEIRARFDSNGNPIPQFYPIKTDGSEKIVLVK